MTLTVAILITLCAISLSGLFSGSEIAFMQSNKIKLEIDANRGRLLDRIIAHFNRSQNIFISTLLIGNNIVLAIYGITISVIINPLLNALFHNDALVLTANTIISTSIILITGEFLPKTVFRINPNTMLRVFAIPLWLIYIILYPISLLTFKISHGLMRLFGLKEYTGAHGPLTFQQLEDYIEQSIDHQPEEKPIENEVKIFRRAIDFKDTQIGECMIPRNEIIAVPLKGTSTQRLKRLFIESGLSKIVVYSDDIDNIVGYIHISELFKPDTDWTTRLKPVLYTPESMLANKMMHRLMAQKKSMAIVVDEFGGTAGLVTLEDLVEEIFGEIEDEHDRNRLTAKQIDANTYEFSGRAEVTRINETFNLDLPESDEYQTLAGYLLDNLEELPTVGQTIDLPPYTFTIRRMSATRIELVTLHTDTPQICGE